MALKKCKECGADVSSRARTCPHCGVTNPTTTGKDMLIGGVAIIVGLVVLIAIFGGSDEDASHTSTAARSAPVASSSTPVTPPTPASKHFSYTAAEYGRYFNATMRTLDQPARLRPHVDEGPVNDVFRGKINEHAQLLGVVDKASGKVASITVIGIGDGTADSGAEILIAALGAMVAAFPDVDMKLVGPEVTALVAAGTSATDKKASRDFRGARLSYQQSDVIGIWITVEPL